jgi:hypothetical protein
MQSEMMVVTKVLSTCGQVKLTRVMAARERSVEGVTLSAVTVVVFREMKVAAELAEGSIGSTPTRR